MHQIIKQSIDCNPVIGKQQWIRFYAEMFVIASVICLKIVKTWNLKLQINCYNFFSLIPYNRKKLNSWKHKFKTPNGIATFLPLKLKKILFCKFLKFTTSSIWKWECFLRWYNWCTLQRFIDSVEWINRWTRKFSWGLHTYVNSSTRHSSGNALSFNLFNSFSVNDPSVWHP